MKSLILVTMLAFISNAYAEKLYQTKSYPARATGLVITEEDRSRMQAMPHREIVMSPIPGEVDLSAQISAPGDQGTCGACWAFALTKALRSEYMLKGVKMPRLEINFLLNNCGSGPRMYGCDGGNFTAADSFLDLDGPGFEKDNPYLAKEGTCANLPVRATAHSYTYVGPSDGVVSFREIAYAIGVEHHMLVTDVAANAGEWANYSGGIYNNCKYGKIDHMINIVGYNCETSVDTSGHCVFDANGRPINKDGYLLLQNSWGEDWGTKAANGRGGYMKSRMYDARGRLCNRVGTDTLYFNVLTPAADEPVGPPAPLEPVRPEKKGCGKFFSSLFSWCKKS